MSLALTLEDLLFLLLCVGAGLVGIAALYAALIGKVPDKNDISALRIGDFAAIVILTVLIVGLSYAFWF